MNTAPNNPTQIAGASIFELTFLVFLVLKLTDKIDWSWWWVTSPLWGPFAAFFALVIVGFLIVALVHIVKAFIPKRQERVINAAGLQLRPV